uniref:Uncharacterized protein n=1 Tax=Strigamia maritima TaxID=126957 RepID=T1J747_STRMM
MTCGLRTQHFTRQASSTLAPQEFDCGNREDGVWIVYRLRTWIYILPAAQH